MVCLTQLKKPKGVNMSAILEVKDLVKKYGDFAAVKGISFDIQEGEIFSLLGPNGAGKTTTISVLSTLYAPTSGDATIGGQSVSKEAMAVRNIIGLVPQELALYDDLSARENLLFWGRMYGLSGRDLSTPMRKFCPSLKAALEWSILGSEVEHAWTEAQVYH
jgi:ABC-type multidrug transport system ATPase subunit